MATITEQVLLLVELHPSQWLKDFPLTASARRLVSIESFVFVIVYGVLPLAPFPAVTVIGADEAPELATLRIVVTGTAEKVAETGQAAVIAPVV